MRRELPIFRHTRHVRIVEHQDGSNTGTIQYRHFLVRGQEQSNGRGRHEYGQTGYTPQEQKKESVISCPNAVADPGTVVIKVIDADVARVAVLATRWSKNIARTAVAKADWTSYGNARFFRIWYRWFER